MRRRVSSTWFTLRRSVVRFMRDDGIDVAAALAFFGLVSTVPALVALVAVVSVTGQAGALDDLLDGLATRVLEPESARSLREVLRDAAGFDGALTTLLVGLAGLLWSASIYVNALGRALNRIFGVDEGRPFWRLRPMQVGVTLVVLLVMSLGLVMVLVTGPVTQVVGDLVGIGDQALAVWDVAKWPVLGFLVILLVALLRHLTPNVRFESFRLITVGTFVSILVMVPATVGFAFYVIERGSYSTYGALTGGVVLGLWLWLANMALIYGAELDVEIERGRQLRAGLPAEERLLLPTRNDRVTLKRQRRDERDLVRMRAIREEADEP